MDQLHWKFKIFFFLAESGAVGVSDEGEIAMKFALNSLCLMRFEVGRFLKRFRIPV